MKPKKKIVHVSYQDPEHLAGGQGVAVLNLAKAQVALGYQVVWLSPCSVSETPGESLFLNGGLRVIKLKIGEGLMPSLFGTAEASQRAREAFGDAFVAFIRTYFRPEDCFIHLHGFVEVPRRARELRNAGYEVTSTFHMFLSPRSEEIGEALSFLPRLKEIERESILANTRIIVNSTQMAAELCRMAPQYEGELFVIPNGVDEMDISPVTIEKDEIPLVVTYGRISPEKGFELFIEAARIVSQNRQRDGKSPVQFIIFGKTDATQPARQAYAQRLEKEIDGENHITLDISAEGVWHQHRLNYLDRSAIGVVPSCYEPFGLVLIEMMARGLPVVSTLTHGAKDVLEVEQHGQTAYGWTTNLKNSEQIAEAIEWLLDHPEQASEMGQNGRKQVEQHYTWAALAPRILSVYEGTKSIARGNVSEAKIHSGLNRAAQEGRLFAVRLDQVDVIETFDVEQVADLLLANLYSLDNPVETGSKLRTHLDDEDFKSHLMRGFHLMKSEIQNIARIKNHLYRLAIVVEEQPFLIFRDSDHNVFAHVGMGLKTATPFTTFYISFHALKFALLQGREADFLATIRQLSEKLETPFKTQNRNHEAVFFIGNHAPRFSTGLPEAARRVVSDNDVESNRLYEAVLAQFAPKDDFIQKDHIPFVELHLTNACNLRCSWCTYLDQLDAANMLPFVDLDRVGALNPEEILIVGGGEPTMYHTRDGKTFDDAILRLRELLPNVRLRLITNGVKVPPGRWQNEIDEVSVSLDGTTPEAFFEHKKRDQFDAVWQNIQTYLATSPIPRVRVTMVYNRANLGQSLLLAKKLWHVWASHRHTMGPVKAEEFRFLIFPSANDKNSENSYIDTRLTVPQQHAWQETLAQHKGENPEFWRFIDQHTNLNSRVFDELLTPSAPRCLSNTNYILVGADGIFYPCFAMCGAAREHHLGKIDQSPEALLTLRKEHIDTPPERCSKGCRPHTVFYGLRAIQRLTQAFSRQAFRIWDQRVNLQLEQQVVLQGVEKAIKVEG